jgi:hypothetical protein
MMRWTVPVAEVDSSSPPCGASRSRPMWFSSSSRSVLCAFIAVYELASNSMLPERHRRHGSTEPSVKAEDCELLAEESIVDY